MKDYFKVTFEKGQPQLPDRDGLIQILRDDKQQIESVKLVEVNETSIEDTIQRKLRQASSVILREHGLDTGDISPAFKTQIDNRREELTDAYKDWIEQRVIEDEMNS